ncbi:MAG TPA: hypothetical protein VE093_16095 [Polyangiaceae bacterium]|jgi:hypothetical protein|nr:hypothetical protein [Polyangiaceae bacterium]
MKENKLLRSRRWVRGLQIAAAATVTLGMGGVMGCLNRPIEPLEPRRTSTIVERLTQSSVDKIDIVLGIDNSRSMADKQLILENAVPDLVRGLVNPRCLDQNGVPAAMQPMGPLEACPIPGTKREFEPVVDIHIGIISSSIGGHGADACPDQENNTCAPMPNFTNNDKGHLVARMSECGGGDVATYQNKSFLAWDPKQKLEPAGEGNLDNLVTTLGTMVRGTGQIGCGYEAQLESWYRFLVDPEPYEKITAAGGKATPEGLDQVLLTQRADFLRPDSLLAILMLTDENDCSIKEFGQFFFAAQLKNQNGTPFHLPRARAECAANPNDPCCKSCGQDPGNCPADPTCFDANNNVKALTDAEDASNLRCYDQKRRFGIDFLYPIDRYTTGLTSVTVPNRAGELVPNPLFSDLNPQDSNSTVRDAGLVFLAGIVGVPWQDIARNKDDLTQGFKSADELLAPVTDMGLTTWDIILGDPATQKAPADPHMIETVFARSGTNPITGDSIKPPGDPSNPINGSEWTVKNQDDLQYACIFDLPEARDCSNASIVSCDCKDPANDNPLCQPDPVDATKRTYQTKAKAYPGVRELQVLQSLGSQGITASVCPKQLNAPDQADYGYRPAIGAIIDRLKIALKGQCLPRTLTPNPKTQQVPCLLLEARRVEDALIGECNACTVPGRQPVSTDHQQAVEAAKQDPIAETSAWNCFCEITQVTGDNLTACQEKIENPPLNSAGEEVNGWCYVDATTSPPTGNVEIVADCPETERRIIRFVGEGGAKAGATIFITCSGE